MEKIIHCLPHQSNSYFFQPKPQLMKNSLLAGLLFFLATNLCAQNKVWNTIADQQIPQKGIRQIIPQKSTTFKLDKSTLKAFLDQVNILGPQKAEHSNLIIELPMPDGTLAPFKVAESPVMAPALAAKYPEIKTYTALGIDGKNAWGRLDWTPSGFHGMIISPKGTVYIDPVQTNDNLHYHSYFKKDFQSKEAQHLPTCIPLDYDPEIKKEMHQLLVQKKNNVLPTPSGTELRTYRTAIAATGEYTIFHGGTVASGLAAIVTAINRVTGIYEVELAIRLQLIANNDLLVYTNGSTDPYSNNNGSALLAENQSNIDAVIGSANYDIGHVFNTGGGGLAGLGVVCSNGNKARGQTGLGNPTGDPFYVDYVAHEIGHQFGGNHTFNGSNGSCSGGNRNASTAYEPGSGSTIQAYAGICGTHNIQNNSDDYFHTASFDEMITYSTISTGNTCPTVTNTGNNVPVPNAGGGGYVIPINTPFELTGSATDADNDPLTYNWEQFDLGAAGDPNNPTGDAPIFRSFPASTSPTRTFPQQSDLLNNTQTIGEILPSYGRNLTFRMTVRDNQLDGGGVDYDQISMTVEGGAGPFLVTAPNTNVSWTGGSTETITWDVANTNIAPVSCANVDILLSTDGGVTFPTTILSGVPNDGSQNIVVPNVATTQARIKIACSDNVFFDLSNVDFTIVLGGDDFLVNASPLLQTVCVGDVVTYNVSVEQLGTYTDPVTLSSNGPGTIGFDPNGNNTPYNSIMSITGATAGTYNFDISGTSLGVTKTVGVELTVIAGPPNAPSLSLPANGATGVDANPSFSWAALADADSYDLEIATDAGFNNIVHMVTVNSNSYNGATLNTNTNYFWRVNASNVCNAGPNSSAFTFTTANILCTVINSTDVPVAISASGTPTVTSQTTFPNAGIINDVKVLDLKGTHSWVGDLDFQLTSPAGTQIEIMERNCGDVDNFDLNLDDAGVGPAPAWPCPPTDMGTYEPSTAFSNFNNQDPAGTWILTITDNVNQDGGQLTGWSIEVCYEPLLPVELTQLKAEAQEKSILLEWITMTEIDNKGFHIERSVDPIHGFENIGWVPATTLATTTNLYQFTDHNAVAGVTYYYRLRQLDFSEQEHISEIVSAKVDGNSWDIILQPNPAKDHVDIITAGSITSPIEIQIFNVNGKALYQQTTTLGNAGDSWSIDLTGFASGVYFLKSESGGEEIVKRLIVR